MRNHIKSRRNLWVENVVAIFCLAAKHHLHHFYLKIVTIVLAGNSDLLLGQIKNWIWRKNNTERQLMEGLLDWILIWWPSPFSSPPECSGLIVSEGQQELLQCQSLPSLFGFRKLLILGGKREFGIHGQVTTHFKLTQKLLRKPSQPYQNPILRHG